MVRGTHVVVGKSAKGADQVIRDLGQTSHQWGWTVPRVARSGDEVFFYLLNPEGSFVAMGQLLGDATPGTSKEGDGSFVADIGRVSMLPSAVSRLDIVDLVPDWG